MIDRPRTDSMSGLYSKRPNRYTTGKMPLTTHRCAIASCGKEFLGRGKALYCSYACWLAAKRITPLEDAPEWRCERFAELDRLIELEDRNGQRTADA